MPNTFLFLISKHSGVLSLFVCDFCNGRQCTVSFKENLNSGLFLKCWSEYTYIDILIFLTLYKEVYPKSLSVTSKI